ncbi:MAG: DUF3237 domain-containing protein [Pseudomonadota bacterium]
MIEPVKTEYLMTLEGSIAQPEIINNLMVFNVLSGSIKGPGISGEMQSPAGDWARIQPNGHWKLDVRFTIMLDDGCPAFVHYHGVVCMTEELAKRVEEGDTLNGDEIYFRSAPYFETNSEKYDFLNNIVCVGKLRTFGGGNVVYDIFKVL